MKVRTPLLISLVAAAIAATPALAQDKKAKAEKAAAAPTAPAAGGKIYSQAQFDAMLKMQTQRGAQDTPELRKAIEEELTTRELLLREAKKAGSDRNADVKAQIEMASQNIVINHFMADYVKSNPVPDAELKKEYDKIKSEIGDKEYKARHVLVDKEDEAKEVIAALQKGEKFEKLAKEKSKDPGSKDNGGELDWASPANFVKEFSDAMTKLEKGKFTAVPVKSQFGWHVIMLDDSRAAKVPSFEEVKPQLQQKMQNVVVQRLIQDLRSKAKI